MAAVDTLVSGSRNFLRDFPVFFEADMGPLNVSTVRLPHPLVPLATLTVATPDAGGVMTPVPEADLQLDERNGLLKFLTTAYFDQRVFISGYHFTWFLDNDLTFHAGRTLIDVSYGQDIDSMDDFTPIEVDTIIMGTVVSALWALTTELALDIDVSTPEGMYIPARQRFAQISQMWQYWSTQFHERMQQLNLGTGRIDIFWLRRVARLTNRLVPVYREREFDDHHRPVRLYPPIPPGGPVTDTSPTLEEIYRSGQEIDWPTLGTSGG